MVLRAVYHALAGMAERAAGKRAGFARAQSLGKLGVSKTHVWRGRNSLLDIDLNIHMNNASFVYLAELARWRMSGANGLLGVALANKWQFIVGAQAFRYRRAIPPFARYEIHTLVEAVDDRWMYLTQTFASPRRADKPRIVYAEATVRAIIVHVNGTKIAPAEVISALGLTDSAIGALQDPKAVAKVQSFLDWDRHTDTSMKATFAGEDAQGSGSGGSRNNEPLIRQT